LKIWDYSKLKGRIYEKYGSQYAFSKEMGMRDSALSGRLNCRTTFTQTEIIKAAKLLEIEPEQLAEYFFTPEIGISQID